MQSSTINDRISAYLDEAEAIVRSISRSEVRVVVDRLFEGWQNRRTTYIIGNGGSASTASHMMNDLNKMTSHEGLHRFRAIALTDNMPLITAIGNDIEYADVFVEQLKNLLLPTDMLIAISGSGNSENIIRACDYARKLGAFVIGLCGNPGQPHLHVRQRRRYDPGEEHLPARRRPSHSQPRHRPCVARPHRRRNSHRLSISDKTSVDKIVSLAQLAAEVGRLKAAGRKVVLCHGVFDLLHYGHILHFREARTQGDALVVTITPDVYVNKGPNRPAFTETYRAANAGGAGDRRFRRDQQRADGGRDAEGRATRRLCEGARL